MADDSLSPDGDPFGPPAVSTLVSCLHCGQEYDSYQIVWRIEQNAEGRPHGFWCCPIAGCDGKGFGFDIFPVDPEYHDENGERMWCSDEHDECGEDEFDEAGNDWLPEASAEEENAGPRSPSNVDEDELPW